MRTLFILALTLLLSYSANAAKVDTVSVYSPSMKKYMELLTLAGH